MVEVSWKPRAFLLKSFLTDEEATHLVNKVCMGARTCIVVLACSMLATCFPALRCESFNMDLHRAF